MLLSFHSAFCVGEFGPMLTSSHFTAVRTQSLQRSPDWHAVRQRDAGGSLRGHKGAGAGEQKVSLSDK